MCHNSYLIKTNFRKIKLRGSNNIGHSPNWTILFLCYRITYRNYCTSDYTKKLVMCGNVSNE